MIVRNERTISTTKRIQNYVSRELFADREAKPIQRLYVTNHFDHMGDYSCFLCQLAFDKGLGNIVPLCLGMSLEHVPKRNDHIICFLILKLLLEFRFHACKHKTTNLKRIITCSLVGVL